VRTGLMGLIALLVVLGGLILAYDFAHSGRVYQGVHVLGQHLGGMDRAEARAALERAGAGYPADPLVVEAAGHVWSFSPAELGVALDIDRTLDAALSFGRSGSFLDDLKAQAGALLGGTSLAPVLTHDPALVDRAVARVAADVDRPAINSRLEKDPDGRVRVTPSSSGTVVDREALRRGMSASLAGVPFAPVQVPMRQDDPKVTEAALKSTLDRAILLTGQPITLKAGERSWTLKPEELRQMLSLSEGANGGWDVALDNNALASYLQPVAEALRVEPKNADVVIDKGTVTLKPDEDGVELDVPSAINAIRQAATNGDPAGRTVQLPVNAVPAAIQTEQIQAVYDRANGLVTQGIRLRFRDDGYILRNSSVTGFIDVVPSPEGPSPLKLVVDEDVLTSRISGVAYNINRPAADAQFRMVNGKPTRVAQAREGYKVNVQKSLQNVLAAIQNYSGGDRLQVDLDVEVIQPTITDADLSAIQTPDLLGTGQTSYANSSAERAWNVGLGARKIDGALVPPGGVFSTVDTIGPLTLDAGFKMGYMIVNQGGNVTTVPAEAGGICQVATTLFHAVFWAGLPVVERNWHSYWISTYGVPPSGMQGLDATIAPPEKDFRFKNTTGHWLLIRGSADGKTIKFQIYGVNPGWKVTASKPVITNVVKTDHTPITEYSDKLPSGKKVLVEHAQDGFDATITRTVTDASGNVIDYWVARSHYVPAHERYLVGTGQ
jgi:vancomycin resistance protein YoaR